MKRVYCCAMRPEGNERLTAAVGLALLVLTGVELLTLLLGLQDFLSWHVFVGFVLIPPLALKLASTGWRFMSYYTRNDAYRLKGPPHLAMRLLAPVLVAATIFLFGSGVALGVVHGRALTLARNIHGPAALAWTILLGIHALVYLPRALRSGRLAVAVATVVAGAAVGMATLPVDHDWLHLPPKHEHDDGRG